MTYAGLMHNDRVVARNQLRRLRSGVRRLLGRAFAAVVNWRIQRTDASIGAAVVYHRIGRGDGHSPDALVPVLRSDLFARQIDYLSRTFELVAPADLPAAVADRSAGARLPLAITFDDDLASHVTDALPILTQSDLPAGFFVCGASLDEAHRFWWERLEHALESRRGQELLAEAGAPLAASEPQTDIHAVGRWFEQLPAPRRELLNDGLREALGGDPPDAGLRSSDVRALADAGFEVGFHTLRHDVLPNLDETHLASALVDGRDRLEDLCGSLGSFAYPHGRHDRRVVAAVRDAGFRVAFTTTNAAVGAADDPLMLSRIEPSFSSVGELAWSLGRALWQQARKGNREC